MCTSCGPTTCSLRIGKWCHKPESTTQFELLLNPAVYVRFVVGIAALGRTAAWPDILADAESPTETDRDRAGRKAVPGSLRPTPGGKLGTSGDRRCPASDRAIRSRRLTTPDTGM